MKTVTFEDEIKKKFNLRFQSSQQQLLKIEIYKKKHSAVFKYINRIFWIFNTSPPLPPFFFPRRFTLPLITTKSTCIQIKVITSSTFSFAGGFRNEISEIFLSCS